MSNLKKRINVTLANGLHIISAKMRKDSSLVTLFVTDFSSDTRILFDMDSKRVLANRDNIELTAKDVENLVAALRVNKKE